MKKLSILLMTLLLAANTFSQVGMNLKAEIRLVA